MQISNIERAARQAREASYRLAVTTHAQRCEALEAIMQELLRHREEIFAANQRDIENAKELAQPLLKRLKFDEKKLNEVVGGMIQLISLPDPIGHTQLATELSPGLELYRVSCPIGVIGVIFESRPDALVQIAGLCLKSGNAVLLKGGSEAAETNRVLYQVIQNATMGMGMPDGWIALMETREDVSDILKFDHLIDLIIPRGSNEFVRYIMDHSRIPVLGHADGLCHVYVDQYADIHMAIDIIVDSKTQYVAVCNAAETLLVHQAVAACFLPAAAQALRQAGVKLRGCSRTCAIIDVDPAAERDWDTEYLDYILSIRVVDSLAEAVAHINRHGSKHTDSIVTNDEEQAAQFTAMVDSAGVFHNCSTRFSDGNRYGFGAEVGVGTGKLHARGPMGLEGLMTYKYILKGKGHTVASFADGSRQYTHRPLDKNDCRLRSKCT